MFIEIAGAVAVGILVATAVIVGIYHIIDNWPLWSKKPEKNISDLPYDPNSPIIKRFQYLAGITESYNGNLRSHRNRFKLRYM